MLVREYTPADCDALRRLHAAQGFGYPFPDLESPLFVSKLVLEDEDSDAEADTRISRIENTNAKGRELAHRDSPPQVSSGSVDAERGHSGNAGIHRAGSGRIAMAVLLRLTAETYLLYDPAAGTPRLRWQRFLALHDAARTSAAARGLDDVQAFLPPRVARAFGRRLTRLGWRHDPWVCFSRSV